MVTTCSQAAIPEITATSRPKTSTLLMIQRWHRPTVETELSLDHERAVHVVEREKDHDRAVRDHEEGQPDELQPRLLAELQVVADEVDAHVGVVDHAVAEHQREQAGVEVPLQLLQDRGLEERCRDSPQPPLQAVDPAGFLVLVPILRPMTSMQVIDDHRHDQPGAVGADEVHEPPQPVGDATVGGSSPRSAGLCSFGSSRPSAVVAHVHQPQRELRERDDEDQPDELDDDERE